MNFAELKERTTELMEENMTLSKLNFVLLGAVMLLAGICLGLLAAPLTHGIMLGSYNGCNSGNNCGSHNGSHNSSDEDCEE